MSLIRRNPSTCCVRDLGPGEAAAYFFPERGQTAAKSRELCRRCVVCAECLEQALTQPEELGVWRGTTPRDRLGSLATATPPTASPVGGGRAATRPLQRGGVSR